MTPQQILENPDLIAVGVAGDEVRRHIHGSRTTFVRVFEIHVNAPPQALPARTDAGEFRIVGAPRSIEAAVAAVRAAVALAGGRSVTGFAVTDLLTLGILDDVVRALAAAGLGAVAQLPVDTVENPTEAAHQIRAAGLTVNTLTVERPDDDARIEMCTRAQHLAAAGGFKAFAPLPRTISPTKPTTGYDDVKTVSLARVMVTNVPSIQVDWQLYGPKMAQVALTVGADDVDNVSAVDPGVLGTRRSPLEEIRGNIKSAGLEPVERDGRFNVK